MSDIAPTVFIVDGSREVGGLSSLLTVAGHPVRVFESAECFLEAQEPDAPGCLLLDADADGMKGLEVQRALLDSTCPRPIVFLTSSDDIQTSVSAMKAGAVDFLTKPIDDVRLLAALQLALQRDAKQRREYEIRKMAQRRLASLSPREREVMSHVIDGLLNKLIAIEMAIQEKTVKVHRARMMTKMGVRSVAELVQLALFLRFQPVSLRGRTLKLSRSRHMAPHIAGRSGKSTASTAPTARSARRARLRIECGALKV